MVDVVKWLIIIDVEIKVKTVLEKFKVGICCHGNMTLL